MLDGAKFLCLNENDEPYQTISAKGRNFTIGYLIDCDYNIGEDERAENIHAEIECDAFGHVRIHNKSEKNPIVVNGETVTIKRTLFNNAKIEILGKKYIWQYHKLTTDIDVCAKDPEEISTPTKQIGIPEQPPSSCPALKNHRDIPKRFTVHNLRGYRLDSKLDTNKSIVENDFENPDEMIDVTPPKVELIDKTPDKTISSTEKKIKEFKNTCGWSGLTITSYSPRETGVRIEKSFTALVPPATSRTNVCRTPKTLLERLQLHTSSVGTMDEKEKSHTELISFATPLKRNDNEKVNVVRHAKSAMKIVDLTTPTKLRPGSPLSKTLSSRKLQPSIKSAHIGFIDKNNLKDSLGVTVLPSTPKIVLYDTPVNSSSSAITVDSSDSIVSPDDGVLEGSNFSKSTPTRAPAPTLRKQALLLASAKKDNSLINAPKRIATANVTLPHSPQTPGLIKSKCDTTRSGVQKPSTSSSIKRDKDRDYLLDRKNPATRKLNVSSVKKVENIIGNSSISVLNQLSSSAVDKTMDNNTHPAQCILTTSTPYKSSKEEKLQTTTNTAEQFTDLQNNEEETSPAIHNETFHIDENDSLAKPSEEPNVSPTVRSKSDDPLMKEIEEILNTSDELKKKLQDSVPDQEEEKDLYIETSETDCGNNKIEVIISKANAPETKLSPPPKSSLSASILLKVINSVDKHKTKPQKEDEEKENKVNDNAVTKTRRRLSTSSAVVPTAAQTSSVLQEDQIVTSVGPLTPKKITKRRPSISLEENEGSINVTQRNIDHDNTENMGAIVEEDECGLSAANEDLVDDKEYANKDDEKVSTFIRETSHKECHILDKEEIGAMSPLQCLDESFAEDVETKGEHRAESKETLTESITNEPSGSENSAPTYLENKKDIQTEKSSPIEEISPRRNLDTPDKGSFEEGQSLSEENEKISETIEVTTPISRIRSTLNVDKKPVEISEENIDQMLNQDKSLVEENHAKDTKEESDNLSSSEKNRTSFLGPVSSEVSENVFQMAEKELKEESSKKEPLTGKSQNISENRKETKTSSSELESLEVRINPAEILVKDIEKEYRKENPSSSNEIVETFETESLSSLEVVTSNDDDENFGEIEKLQIEEEDIFNQTFEVIPTEEKHDDDIEKPELEVDSENISKQEKKIEDLQGKEEETFSEKKSEETVENNEMIREIQSPKGSEEVELFNNEEKDDKGKDGSLGEIPIVPDSSINEEISNTAPIINQEDDESLDDLEEVPPTPLKMTNKRNIRHSYLPQKDTMKMNSVEEEGKISTILEHIECLEDEEAIDKNPLNIECEKDGETSFEKTELSKEHIREEKTSFNDVKQLIKETEPKLSCGDMEPLQLMLDDDEEKDENVETKKIIPPRPEVSKDELCDEEKEFTAGLVSSVEGQQILKETNQDQSTLDKSKLAQKNEIENQSNLLELKEEINLQKPIKEYLTKTIEEEGPKDNKIGEELSSLNKAKNYKLLERGPAISVDTFRAETKIEHIKDAVDEKGKISHITEVVSERLEPLKKGSENVDFESELQISFTNEEKQLTETEELSLDDGIPTLDFDLPIEKEEKSQTEQIILEISSDEEEPELPVKMLESTTSEVSKKVFPENLDESRNEQKEKSKSLKISSPELPLEIQDVEVGTENKQSLEKMHSSKPIIEEDLFGESDEDIGEVCEEVKLENTEKEHFEKTSGDIISLDKGVYPSKVDVEEIKIIQAPESPSIKSTQDVSITSNKEEHTEAGTEKPFTEETSEPQDLLESDEEKAELLSSRGSSKNDLSLTRVEDVDTLSGNTKEIEEEEEQEDANILNTENQKIPEKESVEKESKKEEQFSNKPDDLSKEQQAHEKTPKSQLDKQVLKEYPTEEKKTADLEEDTENQIEKVENLQDSVNKEASPIDPSKTSAEQAVPDIEQQSSGSSTKEEISLPHELLSKDESECPDAKETSHTAEEALPAEIPKKIASQELNENVIVEELPVVEEKTCDKTTDMQDQSASSEILISLEELVHEEGNLQTENIFELSVKEDRTVYTEVQDTPFSKTINEESFQIEEVEVQENKPETLKDENQLLSLTSTEVFKEKKESVLSVTQVKEHTAECPQQTQKSLEIVAGFSIANSSSSEKQSSEEESRVSPEIANQGITPNDKEQSSHTTNKDACSSQEFIEEVKVLETNSVEEEKDDALVVSSQKEDKSLIQEVSQKGNGLTEENILSKSIEKISTNFVDINKQPFEKDFKGKENIKGHQIQISAKHETESEKSIEEQSDDTKQKSLEANLVKNVDNLEKVDKLCDDKEIIEEISDVEDQSEVENCNKISKSPIEEENMEPELSTLSQPSMENDRPVIEQDSPSDKLENLSELFNKEHLQTEEKKDTPSDKMNNLSKLVSKEPLQEEETQDNKSKAENLPQLGDTEALPTHVAIKENKSEVENPSDKDPDYEELFQKEEVEIQEKSETENLSQSVKEKKAEEPSMAIEENKLEEENLSDLIKDDENEEVKVAIQENKSEINEEIEKTSNVGAYEMQVIIKEEKGKDQETQEPSEIQKELETITAKEAELPVNSTMVDASIFQNSIKAIDEAPRRNLRHRAVVHTYELSSDSDDDKHNTTSRKRRAQKTPTVALNTETPKKRTRRKANHLTSTPLPSQPIIQKTLHTHDLEKEGTDEGGKAIDPPQILTDGLDKSTVKGKKQTGTRQRRGGKKIQDMAKEDEVEELESQHDVQPSVSTQELHLDIPIKAENNDVSVAENSLKKPKRKVGAKNNAKAVSNEGEKNVEEGEGEKIVKVEEEPNATVEATDKSTNQKATRRPRAKKVEVTGEAVVPAKRSRRVNTQTEETTLPQESQTTEITKKPTRLRRGKNADLPNYTEIEEIEEGTTEVKRAEKEEKPEDVITSSVKKPRGRRAAATSRKPTKAAKVSKMDTNDPLMETEKQNEKKEIESDDNVEEQQKLEPTESTMRKGRGKRTAISQNSSKSAVSSESDKMEPDVGSQKEVLPIEIESEVHSEQGADEKMDPSAEEIGTQKSRGRRKPATAATGRKQTKSSESHNEKQEEENKVDLVVEEHESKMLRGRRPAAAENKLAKTSKSSTEEKLPESHSKEANEEIVPTVSKEPDIKKPRGRRVAAGRKVAKTQKILEEDATEPEISIQKEAVWPIKVDSESHSETIDLEAEEDDSKKSRVKRKPTKTAKSLVKTTTESIEREENRQLENLPEKTELTKNPRGRRGKREATTEESITESRRKGQKIDEKTNDNVEESESTTAPPDDDTSSKKTRTRRPKNTEIVVEEQTESTRTGRGQRRKHVHFELASESKQETVESVPEPPARGEETTSPERDEINEASSAAPKRRRRR